MKGATLSKASSTGFSGIQLSNSPIDPERPELRYITGINFTKDEERLGHTELYLC